jgi:hypothetical protein
MAARRRTKSSGTGASRTFQGLNLKLKRFSLPLVTATLAPGQGETAKALNLHPPLHP